MSGKLKIAFVFVLAVALSAVVSAQELSRVLPTEVEPLRGDLLQNDSWDFSQQWMSSDRGKTVICTYGDSLLTETIEGRRLWYGMPHDSILYIGEEDRLTVIAPDSAVMFARRPVEAGFSSGNVPFSAAGTGGGRRFRISETGTLSLSSATQSGTLIIAPGDTLRHVMAVRELRAFTATFPDDSTATTTSAVIETYRWYDAEGLRTLMPVAIQRAVYPSVNGGMPDKDAEPSFAMAYLPDRSDVIVNDPKEKEGPDTPVSPDLYAVDAALCAATVYCDGRNVTVAVEMPEVGIIITVDIIDTGGRLYLHESTVSTGAADEVKLVCSGLRSGEYIAAIGVEGLDISPEKRLVIIR
ncbi:MAG: hypothetical protein K2J12_02905 [Muribaculaceae bacterium]|nr:hypothetical protein [Muribaculaceae bacterium]